MDEIKKLYDRTRDLLKKWGVTDEEVEEAKEEIEEKGEDPRNVLYLSRLIFVKNNSK